MVVTLLSIAFGATELWRLTKFGKRENRLQFRSPYLLVRLCYCNRIYTKLKPFPCTLWWSSHCWWHSIQIWNNPALKSTVIMKDVNMGKLNLYISSTKKTLVLGLTPQLCSFRNQCPTKAYHWNQLSFYANPSFIAPYVLELQLLKVPGHVFKVYMTT